MQQVYFNIFLGSSPTRVLNSNGNTTLYAWFFFFNNISNIIHENKDAFCPYPEISEVAAMV